MVRFWLLTILGVLLIVVDQVTKLAILDNFHVGETRTVIDGFFSLAYVRNEGAAFGFGNQSAFFQQYKILKDALFLFLPVVFCGWICVMFARSLKGPLYVSLAYALILAGAIGNLIDRFRLGFVVDFFMFYWRTEEHHFHVFNVADSCVSVAAGLLIIDFYQQWKSRKTEV